MLNSTTYYPADPEASAESLPMLHLGIHGDWLVRQDDETGDHILISTDNYEPDWEAEDGMALLVHEREADSVVPVLLGSAGNGRYVYAWRAVGSAARDYQPDTGAVELARALSTTANPAGTYGHAAAFITPALVREAGRRDSAAELLCDLLDPIEDDECGEDEHVCTDEDCYRACHGIPADADLSDYV